ncbi:hypothetical protein ACLQ2J_15290 [Streptomyces cyaneofuscatus]|uniref:hypothetical protein n=1 Tax=Streptomyces cyaneofuscatus TaxID=66883 RepID=UPI003CEE82B4
MDGGLAAVLGAFVGVSGTIGSAWLGYHASRTQVREQASIAHVTRLREERREAYLSFISTTEHLEVLLRKFNPEDYSSVGDVPRTESGEIDWNAIKDFSQGLQEVQHSMYQSVSRVDLAGPSVVAKHCGYSWLHVLALRDMVESAVSREEMNPRTLDQLKLEVSAFHNWRNEFMREAQEALQKQRTSDGP